MAKKQAIVTTGKLQGKTVALVGKFGYKDWHREKYAAQVRAAGGTVVDAGKTIPEILLVGEGRGGKPPGDVARLQKKSPAIEVLDLAAFHRLFLPSPEELLGEIAKGTKARGDDNHVFWENLQQSCREAGVQIDLTKADLRKADLYGAHLEGIHLNGSDLCGAMTQYAQFGALEKVNFDGCQGTNTYLTSLKNCTFRNADLTKVWMFYGRHYGAAKGMRVEKCDFTGAKMAGARIEHGELADCTFANVDLSDAEMEESVFERADFSKANLTRVHACESKFEDAVFSNSNLHRADFRKASMRNASLRNANLREAVLSDADLTGANVAGADFQDAVLTGAKLDGVDFSKAKNFAKPVTPIAGPKLLELAAAAAGSKNFSTSAEVDLGKNEFAKLILDTRWGLDARSRYCRDGNEVFDRISASTVEQAILELANRWPKATLRLDSIKAKGSKAVRGRRLQELAVAAWVEAFGVPILSPEELEAQRTDQGAQALRERDALMKKIRSKGAKVWNSMDYRLRDRVDLRGADLSNAKIGKFDMWGRDLKEANFAGSALCEAEFWNGKLENAVFTGADLTGSRFENAVLNGANFRDAVLTGANFSNAKLLGVDLTGATLKDANFFKAQFDQKTIFPTGFKPPDGMVWKGDGTRPGEKKAKAAKAGSLTFDAFLEQLNKKVDMDRMHKAGSMLKAERFQLFADVKDDGVAGIVKSQSNAELVYSCRLKSTGEFGCCTQNLRPCGGLRGALCKHLLVLIVGLAKAGQLDSAIVDHWIDLSVSHKPAIDTDSMSATFLRYKGAEAGEVDWRPMETIPEDFYAM